MEKAVIIGGGACGSRCAVRLRMLDENVEIVLLERGPHVSLDTSLLPRYVGETVLSRNAILPLQNETMRSLHRIDVRVLSEAVDIDRSTRTVTVLDHATGETYAEPYDDLIVATEALPARSAIPGMGSPRVCTLQTLEDAERIRALVAGDKHTGPATSAVVVGGGPAGLEIAANLHAAGLNVTIVESGSHVMPQLDFEFAQLLHEVLVTNGVALHLSDGAASFEDLDDRLAVTLESGMRLKADLAVLATDVPSGNGRGMSDTAIVRFFDLMAATTGESETALVERGLMRGRDFDAVIVRDGRSCRDLGAASMTVKLLHALPSGKLLGAQTVGGDQCIDTLAAVLRMEGTVADLSRLGATYASPFSSSLGFIAEAGSAACDQMAGLVRFSAWDDPETLENVQVVDVRELDECDDLPFPGATNIPLEQLRERLAELDPARPTITASGHGMRAYAAARVLMQHGFAHASVYPAGARFYKSTHLDVAAWTAYLEDLIANEWRS